MTTRRDGRDLNSLKLLSGRFDGGKKKEKNQESYYNGDRRQKIKPVPNRTFTYARRVVRNPAYNDVILILIYDYV